MNENYPYSLISGIMDSISWIVLSHPFNQMTNQVLLPKISGLLTCSEDPQCSAHPAVDISTDFTVTLSCILPLYQLMNVRVTWGPYGKVLELKVCHKLD